MRFEWDPQKDRSNLVKHGLSFEEAVKVFEDPFHLSKLDRFTAGEERWLTLGRVKGQTLVVVVHTWREDDQEDVVRLISARRASRKERKAYEQE